MQIKSPINLSESIDIVESIASEQIITLYDELGLNVRPLFQNISEVFVCQCKESKLKFYAPAQIAGDAAFYEALEKTTSTIMPIGNGNTNSCWLIYQRAERF